MVDPADVKLTVSSKDVIESMTANVTYKSITINGGDTEKSVTFKATEFLTIDGLDINGEKDAGNGKINFYSKDTTINNVTIVPGSTSYNVFEGSQITDKDTFFSDNFEASNITVNDPALKHNVANVYTPADNANIKISDSTFNLNVANSNILRMANYSNAKNVNITFENIDWTYENVEASDSDWGWAGLLIY